jgi:transcriptional/translational regulatory protein YebC/TACO1
MFEAALEAGAEDVVSGDEIHEVITNPDDFAAVRDGLEAKVGAAESARLAWRPNITTAVDAEPAEALFQLIEALEDNDDVQTVSANYEVADEVVQRLSA